MSTNYRRGKDEEESAISVGCHSPLLSRKYKSRQSDSVKGYTVLLAIDDGETGFEPLAEALRHEGCLVLMVRRGNEGELFAEFTKNRPDIVVLDQGGTCGAGIDIAAEILSMRSETRIVMLSESGELVPEEAEKIGIELFLRKPLSAERFARSILSLTKLARSYNITQR